jgi:type IV secretory pathway VirB4 component
MNPLIIVLLVIIIIAVGVLGFFLARSKPTQGAVPLFSPTVKGQQKPASVSTQMYLPIAEFKDNLVILKNGGLRAVIKTSSLNFNLKSEDEQNAIIASYQGFLNTLEFPIQLVVRSKKLDIDKYIARTRELAGKQTNALLQKQTYEYADYVQRLVEYVDIMEKAFYAVVPYDPLRSQNIGFWKGVWRRLHPVDSLEQARQRNSEFESLKKGLSQRVNVVKTGLENMNLKTNQLSTSDLIELFYGIYNPETAPSQKLEGGVNKLKLAT